MKPRFTPITLTTAFVLSTVGILVQHTAAVASEESSLTPSQAERIAHNFVPSSSQDFFEQGENKIEEEIQKLTAPASSEPILKINVDALAEQDCTKHTAAGNRFPQQQPSNRVQPIQSQEFLGGGTAPLQDNCTP